MGGIVKKVTNFAGDFVGLGETEAQQRAKDQAQFANNQAMRQFMPLERGTEFAGRDVGFDPFSAGGLSLQGRNLQGVEGFNAPGRASLDRFSQATEASQAATGRELADLTGNQNAFIRARVNPLQDRLERRRHELRSNLQRRQVQGSFGNQDLTNLDIAGERGLGDARALATNEAIMARQPLHARGDQLNAQLFNAEQAVNSGEFARAVQGLNIPIAVQQNLQALIANLFTGSSQTSNAALGVGTAGMRTGAELETGQFNAFGGLLGGLLNR